MQYTYYVLWPEFNICTVISHLFQFTSFIVFINISYVAWFDEQNLLLCTYISTPNYNFQCFNVKFVSIELVIIKSLHLMQKNQVKNKIYFPIQKSGTCV